MTKLPSFASLLLVPAIMIAAPAPAAAATEQQATRYVTQMGDKAIGIISDKSLSKPEKAHQLEDIFNTSVDFPWIARFVMGRYWREASEAQRARYIELYQRFLVLHYATLFSDYTGGSYKLLYTHADGDDQFSVGMQISAGADAGEPVVIEYKLRADGNKFRVYDVIIEGVSMLTTQRAEFASILNSKGIDYLIEQLQKKSESIAAKS